MSLSNPRGNNPVRKFFKVRASTGDLVFYDKSQSREVVVSVPFSFVVLDSLSTVGGFHEPSKSGIWANEVRSSSDVLRVRTRGGSLIEGPYSQIRDRLRGLGGKFASSVYIAYKEGDETALGNITFIGASLSEWLDFKKGKSLDSDPGVTVAGFEHRTKGRTEYFVPKFDRFTVPEAALREAAGLDRELQQYLDASLSRTDTAEPANDPAPQQSPWDTPAQSSFGGGTPLSPSPPF